jgi:hypothetical protein
MQDFSFQTGRLLIAAFELSKELPSPIPVFFTHEFPWHERLEGAPSGIALRAS